MQEVENQIGVRLPVSCLSEEEMGRIKSDPVAMYMHSLRTHSRLPEDLHESMLIHSFDPESAYSVRSYLEWVAACEEREARAEAFRRREKMIDRMIIGSLALGTAGYVFLLFMTALK
jgi:hypothetical protein